MNVKSYAQERNLTQAKVRDLAKELFGSVPTSFDSEQIKKLDASLAGAALAISGVEGLSVADTVTPQVIEIVGTKEIQKNLLGYLQLLRQQFDADEFKAQSLIFQAEQAFYNKLATRQLNCQSESLARISRNSQLWHKSGIIEAQPVDQEEQEILGQIAQLMDEFSIC